MLIGTNCAATEYIKLELDNKIVYEGNVSGEQYAKIQKYQKNIEWAKSCNNYLDTPQKNLETIAIGILLLAWFFNIRPEIVIPVAAAPFGLALTGVGLTMYEKHVNNALQNSIKGIK
jgi:hypothetical protein